MRKTTLRPPVPIAIATLSLLAIPLPTTYCPTFESVAYASEASDAKTKWESLQSEAEEAYDALTNTKAKVSETEDQIRRNKERLEELSAQLREEQTELGRLVERDYKNPLTSMIDAILGADTIPQMIERVEYSCRFIDEERRAVESVTSVLTELSDAQSALETSKELLVSQQLEQESALATAEAKAEEAKDYYGNLSAEARRDITQSDIESRISARNDADSTRLATSTGTAVDTMVERAYSIIGSGYSWSGYVWTGDTMSSVFTCSGVVDYALGRSSRSSSPESLYAEVGSNMVYDTNQLEYGDIVFYASGGRFPTGHTGIYVGNGMIIDSIPSGGVQIRDVNYMSFVGGGPIV